MDHVVYDSFSEKMLQKIANGYTFSRNKMTDLR